MTAAGEEGITAEGIRNTRELRVVRSDVAGIEGYRSYYSGRGGSSCRSTGNQKRGVEDAQDVRLI